MSAIRFRCIIGWLINIVNAHGTVVNSTRLISVRSTHFSIFISYILYIHICIYSVLYIFSVKNMHSRYKFEQYYSILLQIILQIFVIKIFIYRKFIFQWPLVTFYNGISTRKLFCIPIITCSKVLIKQKSKYYEIPDEIYCAMQYKLYPFFFFCLYIFLQNLN